MNTLFHQMLVIICCSVQSRLTSCNSSLQLLITAAGSTPIQVAYCSLHTSPCEASGFAGSLSRRNLARLSACGQTTVLRNNHSLSGATWAVWFVIDGDRGGYFHLQTIFWKSLPFPELFPGDCSVLQTILRVRLLSILWKKNHNAYEW